MIDQLLPYWPILIIALLVIAAVNWIVSRRQRVEIGTIDPVLSPTLARRREASPIHSIQPLPGASDLLRIKGLGPKIAARLNEIGITQLEQLASLNAAQAEKIDAQLGSFAGRMARDCWIEQAGLLARGNIVSFEAKFGKLDSPGSA